MLKSHRKPRGLKFADDITAPFAKPSKKGRHPLDAAFPDPPELGEHEPALVTDEQLAATNGAVLPAKPKQRGFHGHIKGRPGSYSPPDHTKLVTALEGGKKHTLAEIGQFKATMIGLMTTGKAQSVSDAAVQLEINPVIAWRWVRNDPVFKECIDAVRQVAADKLEAEFMVHANFIPKLMLLKGYRPEFRDNAPITLKSDGLEAVLKELATIARGSAPTSPALITTVTVEPTEIIESGNMEEQS